MSSASLAWRQFRLERKLFWRNPSAAFFSFLLPLLLLALFGAIFSGNRHDLQVIVAGIAGLSVMSTTFTALAYNITSLREQGILKRMRGTPMPSSSYLVGIAANAVMNTVVQMTIIILVGKLVFGLGWPRDWAELAVFVVVGVVCFAALGVALSHAIPNFDSAPAYVNAVTLPVIFVSGVFYDVKHVPGFLRGVAEALPLKHVIDGLSGALVSGAGMNRNVTALGVIVAWGVLGVALAIRGFSWEQRRS